MLYCKHRQAAFSAKDYYKREEVMNGLICYSLKLLYINMKKILKHTRIYRYMPNTCQLCLHNKYLAQICCMNHMVLFVHFVLFLSLSLYLPLSFALNIVIFIIKKTQFIWLTCSMYSCIKLYFDFMRTCDNVMVTCKRSFFTVGLVFVGATTFNR